MSNLFNKFQLNLTIKKKHKGKGSPCATMFVLFRSSGRNFDIHFIDAHFHVALKIKCMLL